MGQRPKARAGQRTAKPGTRSRQPPAPASRSRPEGEMRRKLVALDAETWNAVDLLARDSLKSFQELTDEAFRDLLRKHDRPVELRDQLKRSVADSARDGPKAKPRRAT